MVAMNYLSLSLLLSTVCSNGVLSLPNHDDERSSSSTSRYLHELIQRQQQQHSEQLRDLSSSSSSSSSSSQNNPRHHRTLKQKMVRQFNIMDAQTIHDNLFAIAEKYPDLTILESAQDSYGLPSPGEAKDCMFDHFPGVNRRLGDLHDYYADMGRPGFVRRLKKDETSATDDDDGGGKGGDDDDDSSKGDDDGSSKSNSKTNKDKTDKSGNDDDGTGDDGNDGGKGGDDDDDSSKGDDGSAGDDDGSSKSNSKTNKDKTDKSGNDDDGSKADDDGTGDDGNDDGGKGDDDGSSKSNSKTNKNKTDKSGNDDDGSKADDDSTGDDGSAGDDASDVAGTDDNTGDEKDTTGDDSTGDDNTGDDDSTKSQKEEPHTPVVTTPKDDDDNDDDDDASYSEDRNGDDDNTDYEPFTFNATELTGSGCKNWILTIEDTLAHPVGSDSWKALPEVFLSGAVHGDERVGPTVVTEMAILLLDAAHCEALPRGVTPGEDADQLLLDDWDQQVKEAESCRKTLEKRGIAEADRKWLARLVTTRRIVILPTANALGYFRHTREEDGIDPNRDFPYDLKSDEDCMKSVAARCINEIFRRHMFQLSITFHSGQSSITYEWGAPTYKHNLSPDDEAQKQLVGGYVKYGGEFKKMGIPEYESGTMNDVVYPVRGGMEDWAYAGSWDTKHVKACTPDTWDGYPEEKTTYDDSTLRVFNTLVETSDFKTPPTIQLGTDEALFDPASKGTGHIPRNIRLGLLMVDVVEPYVAIRNVQGAAIVDDIIPMRRRARRSCIRSKSMSIPADHGSIKVEWTVGGGFNIDESALIVAKWNDLPVDFDGENQPLGDANMTLVSVINGDDVDGISISKKTEQGRTKWHEDKAFPFTSHKDFGGGPMYSASFNIDDYEEGDVLAIFSYAKLDQYWKTQPSDVKPDVPPQSHIVNARTNPSWLHERGNQTVRGRLDWFSIPVTIVIGEKGGEVVELSERLPAGNNPDFFTEEIEEIVEDVEEHAKSISIMGVVLGVVGVIFLYVVQKKIRYRKVTTTGGDVEVGEFQTTHTID